MSELDQTIEELEAEVLAELEEAAHDAPTKGSAPAEKMKKAKTVGNDEIQDGGEAAVKADAASLPTDVAADKATEVSGDAQQKGEGKPDPMQKIKKVRAEAAHDDKDKDKDDDDDDLLDDDDEDDDEDDDDLLDDIKNQEDKLDDIIEDRIEDIEEGEYLPIPKDVSKETKELCKGVFKDLYKNDILSINGWKNIIQNPECEDAINKYFD